MLLFIIEKHLIWSRTNADGGTTSYYYYDWITWLVVGLILLSLTLVLIRAYLRTRALRRPRQQPRANYRMLKRVIKRKRKVSQQYLRPGFSTNIHAVGIGRIGDEYCIQVFVSDATREWSIGSGAASLPATFEGTLLIMVEMAPALFMANCDSVTEPPLYQNGIREREDVILGGISGANTNLTGESGTIGYFCTRKRKFSRCTETFLLSNSHVFADLCRTDINDSDLIVQPSPGEAVSNRPIASLVKFSPVTFDDIDRPNHIDAAIAKLWPPNPHKLVVPFVGAVKGYVKKEHIELGETVCKFGRSTGRTTGHVSSICLDIWILYNRTGRSAFFQDQVLIEPDLPEFTSFARSGDSGSLVFDANQHALGLIFAGRTDSPAPPESVANVRRIESYGVANPISEVLDRLKIELLIEDKS